MRPPACNTGVITPSAATEIDEALAKRLREGLFLAMGAGEGGTPSTAHSPTITPAAPRGPTLPTLDALACHVEADVAQVCKDLRRDLGLDAHMARGLHGYSFGVDLKLGADVVARIWYGGELPDPFLQVMGPDSQSIENCLRASGYVYRVTRKDAAVDVYDAEWFGVMVSVMRRYATDAYPPRRVEFVGDWLHAKKGRTIYLGSRKSKHLLRMYEKGRQLGADPHWVRLEAEYKPQDRAEQLHAARLTAPQVWALRAYDVWGAALGWKITDLYGDASPPPPPERRSRDQDRARAALCTQYGRTIEDWLAELGGDPAQLWVEVVRGIEAAREKRSIQATLGAMCDTPELNP